MKALVMAPPLAGWPTGRASSLDTFGATALLDMVCLQSRLIPSDGALSDRHASQLDVRPMLLVLDRHRLLDHASRRGKGARQLQERGCGDAGVLGVADEDHLAGRGR